MNSAMCQDNRGEGKGQGSKGGGGGGGGGPSALHPCGGPYTRGFGITPTHTLPTPPPPQHSDSVTVGRQAPERSWRIPTVSHLSARITFSPHVIGVWCSMVMLWANAYG